MHDHAGGGDGGAHSFDGDYWERHWEESASAQSAQAAPADAPNPYLVRGAGGLSPGTALDAGCGTGAEAVWLAVNGWHVTGADISRTALARAAERAAAQGVSDRVAWLRADLVSWVPEHRYDLVTSGYAHPAMPQLAFYQRISDWVAPGGTLLIVGHLHEDGGSDGGGERHGHSHGDSDQPPVEATVRLADITGLLDPALWSIAGAEEQTRTLTGPDGHGVSLNDVVVQATRRS